MMRFSSGSYEQEDQTDTPLSGGSACDSKPASSGAATADFGMTFGRLSTPASKRLVGPVLREARGPVVLVDGRG
jgi:hypothetical protein